MLQYATLALGVSDTVRVYLCLLGYSCMNRSGDERLC